MCDYSLMAFPNRLAVAGEDLVVHRFAASLGLASPADVRRVQEASAVRPNGFFARLKRFLSPPSSQCCTAVCVPPGARLLVRDIPVRLQRELCLTGDVEKVTFTQVNTIGFRDTIRFDNGAEVLLQRLREGQRVRVLALSQEEYETPQVLHYGSLTGV